MLELQEFVAEDAARICPYAVDERIRNDEEYWRKWAKTNAESGPGYTAFYEGRPIGAAGIRLLDDGAGCPWLVMTREATRHKKDVIRSLRIMLRILVKDYKLKKLVTDSRKGFAASQRFLEHLGFKRTSETDNHYFYSLEF
jgi:RimJ/RimL family protein N-acetyltransferase